MLKSNESSGAEQEDMRLGVFEFLAMNNPFRRWIQKHIEFSIFKKQLEKRCIDLESGVIMDAGCGSGYSTQLLVNEYHPSHLVAFDYMPEQIRLARKRKLEVDFAVGDLRKAPSADATCDAVFIFGVLHHIAQWQKALFEVASAISSNRVSCLS
jgi:ubiquinone/menaquinone biosynthesis C-methylase UbiE